MSKQFNVGKDIVLSIVGPTGPLQQLGLLEEFDAVPETNTLRSLPINNNGIPVFRTTYQGWKLTFTFARTDGIADILHNLLETNFFAGNPDIHFFITEQIRNPDGTTDTFTYLDVSMAMESAGKFQQDDKVQQRFRGSAAQRV